MTYVPNRLNTFQTLEIHDNFGNGRIVVLRVNTDKLARRGQLRPSKPDDDTVIEEVWASGTFRYSNREDSALVHAQIAAAQTANARNLDYYTIFPQQDRLDRKAWATITGRSK